MAFYSILRRSASSFAPLAVRALRSQWNCHSAIFTTRIVSSEPRVGPFLPPRSYSTDWPNDNLVRFLNSVIQCDEETDHHDRVEEAPVGFPFKIEDDLGCETITLSREYRGEEIKVEFSIDDLGTEDDSGDDKWDDDDEKANRPRLPLFVSVAKGNGQFIEFYGIIYRDKIVIGWLVVKKPEYSNQIAREGQDFEYFDENLQKAFHKYLAIRGIRASMANFLYEYLTKKDDGENLMSLTNLKKLVEA